MEKGAKDQDGLQSCSGLAALTGLVAQAMGPGTGAGERLQGGVHKQ